MTDSPQQALQHVLGEISSFVWGPAMLVLILGTGLFLTAMLRFMPVRRIGTAFRLLFRGRHAGAEPGDITPFQTLFKVWGK